MGLGHRQDINARRASTNNIRYFVWFLNRQNLFGPHPSAYMLPGAVVDITVHASRVEGGAVNIFGVPYDASLRHSLISAEYAQATEGTIVQTEPALSLYDADGNIYTSLSYITLRWWFYGDSVSNREDFYITNDLPTGRHAMLRRPPGDTHHKSKALPLFNKVQTAEEKQRAEERRKQEDNAHKVIRQAENKKIEDETRNLTSSTGKPNSHCTYGVGRR